MKLRYLHLFSASQPNLGMIATYDLVAKKWIKTNLWIGMDADLVADLEAYGISGCFFYRSRFRDLLAAEFKRNRDGEIGVSDRPKKLTLNEGIVLATKIRNVSPKSLANLKPEALTDRNRYVKKVTIFTENVLEQAIQHRRNGMAIRKIAVKLGVNYESLRKTLRTRGGGAKTPCASLIIPSYITLPAM